MGKKVLEFETEASPFCCGVTEIGDFSVGIETSPNWWGSTPETDENFKEDASTDQYYLATTTRTQTGVVKRLKKMGFKKLATWTRDNGVKLTLWGYKKRRS